MSPCSRYYLIMIVLFCCGCSDAPQLQKLAPDAVILAFGDSLTFGTGTNRKNSYPSVLQKNINIRVINSGVPGEVTATGLKRLKEELIEHQPHLVILCHGGNDILRRYDKNNTRENLSNMVKLVRDYGADIVLVAVPEFGLIPSAAPLYGQVAEEYNIPVEMDIVPSLERRPAFKSDAIHFNKEGYAAMAKAIVVLLHKHNAI